MILSWYGKTCLPLQYWRVSEPRRRTSALIILHCLTDCLVTCKVFPASNGVCPSINSHTRPIWSSSLPHHIVRAWSLATHVVHVVANSKANKGSILKDDGVDVVVWLQDEEALQETAKYYDTLPIIVPQVAHDMMLDVNWELAATTIGEVVATFSASRARV